MDETGEVATMATELRIDELIPLVSREGVEELSVRGQLAMMKFLEGHYCL